MDRIKTKGKIIDDIYTDLEKAFDEVSHAHLEKQLKIKGPADPSDHRASTHLLLR